MRNTLALALTAAAVFGGLLTPVAASAAALGPAAASRPPAATANSQAFSPSRAGAQAAGDPPTALTFTVTSGALSMTAPVSANLGSGAPGGTITGPLGTVAVTDDRALLSASWTVTASSTSFITGSGTPAETIAPTAATYIPGTITSSGTITVTPSTITLSGTAQTVVAATAGSGNNSASWNPTINVSVPSSVAGGAYAGTLTESVS